MDCIRVQRTLCSFALTDDATAYNLYYNLPHKAVYRFSASSWRLFFTP